MLILHIADIHFQEPACKNGLDPNKPYRTRLVQDLRTRVRKLGKNVDAILIGGDIAYKGAADEYVSAQEWIKELAQVAKCPLARVFVVPGNHDVDRNVAKQQPLVQALQDRLANTPIASRDRELTRLLRETESGRTLLAPLAAYNEFAKFFSCQVYAPENLFWIQKLPLENGVQLRIYGLTSTVLSGRPNIEDTPLSLYLSPIQTVLDPVDNVVNLVLCHHPPDWFSDHDEVNDCISSRAALHLFGHTHRQRTIKHDEYMRFSAGAVNPEKNEPGFLPGYNLIELHVDGVGDERMLNIAAHQLQWQPSPEGFRPVMTKGPNSKEFSTHKIPIPDYTDDASVSVPEASPEPEKSKHAGELVPSESEADIEVSMSEADTRNLIYRFWSLSVSARLNIAQNLNLLKDEDKGLPEPEKYGRALRRAAERNLLAALAEEIRKKEK